MVALCADNTNCNFGGAARRGRNNIFHKMQDFLDKKLIGVNCVTHILNNCVQTASDLLPVDVEVLIIKIYSFFYIYTVRVEKLKEICDNADVEYKKLLGHSKTRWLTLFPALERILKLFKPLKEYFLLQEKCPQVILKFFNDPCAELWFLFIQSQAFFFHKCILHLESQNLSMTEASLVLKDFKLKLKERRSGKCLPFTVKNALSKLEVEGNIDAINFKAQVDSFYQACIDYLSQWDAAFKDVEHFEWTLLNRVPSWNSIEKSLSNVLEFRKNIKIKDDELFDEVSCVKRYASKEQIEKWKTDNLSPSEKWVEIFKHFDEENVKYENILRLVEFSLSLPASNAPTERVFSISNNIWTPEKSQLKVDTLEAMLITKCNYDYDCGDFKTFLRSRDDILKKIHCEEKYKN